MVCKKFSLANLYDWKTNVLLRTRYNRISLQFLYYYLFIDLKLKMSKKHGNATRDMTKIISWLKDFFSNSFNFYHINSISIFLMYFLDMYIWVYSTLTISLFTKVGSALNLCRTKKIQLKINQFFKKMYYKCCIMLNIDLKLLHHSWFFFQLKNLYIVNFSSLRTVLRKKII